MKVFYVILGVAIVAVIVLTIVGFSKNLSGKVAGVTTYQKNDPNAPQVIIPEKKFDFGKISLNDVAKHDFKIKNDGKSPLIITGIITSCHCTSAILKIPDKADSPEFGMHQDSSWRGEIAPGVEASLEAIYKPALMPVKGAVSRVVTLSTNDPNNTQVQLEITADVE